MQQSVMPENLTDDILVEYAPILEDVTQPTLQTVFFKGAGEATPSVNIQSDFTFTGKYNQAEDTYTWIKTAIPMLRLMSQLSKVTMRTRLCWYAGCYT